MMRRRKTGESGGIRHEIVTIVRQGREVWRLIPWRYRLSLAGAVGIMSVASAANMAIASVWGSWSTWSIPRETQPSHKPH